MEKKTLSTENIIYFLFINLFIVAVTISTLSSYKLYTFYLKAVLTLLLFLSIYFDLLSQKKSLNNYILQLLASKKLILVISLFISIPAITLFYTDNIEFGIQKIITLLSSTIPLIIVAHYLLNTITHKKKIILLLAVILQGSIMFLIFIFNPFSYNGNFNLSPSNWSHVIAGRFISVSALILFASLFYTDKKYHPVLIIFTPIFLYGVYFTGLRAAMIGLPLLFTFIIFVEIIKNKNIKSTLLTTLIPIVLTFTLILLFPHTSREKPERITNLLEIENIDLRKDGAINARLIAYEISLDMIKDSPLIGNGIGGFAQIYKGNELPLFIKYPHNIFIEAAVEFGLIGFTLITLLLFYIGKSIYKYSPLLFYYFLFTLWLALFSKDIPTQSMLLICIPFVIKLRE